MVERDVRRRSHDHHDRGGVDGELLQRLPIGLEVEEVVLLLQARVREELLRADPETAQPLRRHRVREQHPLRQPAADPVLGDGVLVVVHVRLGHAEDASGDREVVGAVG